MINSTANFFYLHNLLDTANFKLTVKAKTEGGTDTVKYFDYMQSALNYIYSQTEQNYAGNATDPYIATVDLLQSVGDDDSYGEGFLIGGPVTGTTSASISSKKATTLTINLNGHDYIFTKELSSSADGITVSGIRKAKGISISAVEGLSVTINGGDGSEGDTTQGTISVSNQRADRFQRIIRSYSDLTLNNVKLDGNNVSNQNTQEDGAVLCHTRGTLNLTGSTSVLAKDNNGATGSNAYFAVSGKLSNDSTDGYNDGYTINVNTTGEITNIGLYKWKGTNADFTTQTADLNIIKGTVGEVTYGLESPTDGTSQISGITTANVKNVVSLTGGALGTADSITAAALDTGYFFAPAGGKNYVTNQNGWYGATNNWSYITAPTEATATSVGSALASLTGANTTLTLSNANSIAAGIVFNANDTVAFGDITKYTSFTATDVASSIKVTGNEYLTKITGGGLADSLTAGVAKVTLAGGAGDDTLDGASKGENTFVFSGGADVIKGRVAGDIVNLDGIDAVTDGAKISTYGSNGGFAVDFGDKGTLSFDDSIEAKVRSEGQTYTYAKDFIALNKSVTLATGATGYTLDSDNNYNAVDASAATGAVSLVGNSYANTLTAGANGSTLDGGDGNDNLTGGTGADTFVYGIKSGKDVIYNYGADDKFSVTAANITSGTTNNNDELVFKIDNSNAITFKPTGDKEDQAVTKVLLTGGSDSLTKDGVLGAADSILTVFAEQKGKVDLGETSIYGGIAKGIDASKVTKNSITMAGGAQGGTFTFAANKKADVFEYGGGAVTLNSYEAGTDKINLVDASLTSFSVSGNDVIINPGDSAISLVSGKDQEVLLRDVNSKNNSYTTMFFHDTGVLYDKKNATSATLSAGAGGDASLYSATETPTIKKIMIGGVSTAISVQAGNRNNTIIDASGAGAAVSLIGGDKNDKLTGREKGEDTFVFTAGKDVITNYETADKIVLNGDFDLGDAKITQSKKSVTLKFSNKNSLAIKSEDAIGTININGTDYNFGKNAVITGSVASLTSNFSGTYKAGSDVTTIDGSAIAKKNYTMQGTSTAETLTAGGSNSSNDKNKKVTFKGGGGGDSFIGGKSKDSFFYARNDTGETTVDYFDYANDNIKIKRTISANGITKDNNGLKFDMGSGSLTLKTDDKNNNIGSSNVLIKANNTLYWFEGSGDDYGLYTAKDSESKAQIKSVLRNKSDYAIVDLNYSTNLIKGKVAKETETVFTAAMAENYKIK